MIGEEFIKEPKDQVEAFFIMERFDFKYTVQTESTIMHNAKQLVLLNNEVYEFMCQVSEKFQKVLDDREKLVDGIGKIHECIKEKEPLGA